MDVEVNHPYHAQHVADGKRTVNLTKAKRPGQKSTVSKSRHRPNKKKKKPLKNKSKNNISCGSESKNSNTNYARKKRSQRGRHKPLQHPSV